MRSYTIYMIAAILLTTMSVAACCNKKGEVYTVNSDSIAVNNDSLNNNELVLKHLLVDKHKIMFYVTCSEPTIDSLLAIADTVFSQTKTFHLKDLNMGDAIVNDGLQKRYNDTIPLVIAFFDAHARMVNAGMDEVSATFVWHEAVTLQMKQFFEKGGGKWNETNGSEAIFCIIDDMMRVYDSGNQYDMNCAAWRSAMPIEYRLIECYKQLIDLCKDAQVVKLVHDDYTYTLKTFRAYCSSSDEWYSNLLREQGVTFQMLLEAKLNYTQSLIYKYKHKRAGINTIKRCLKQHRVIWFNHDMRLTKDLLINKVD